MILVSEPKNRCYLVPCFFEGSDLIEHSPHKDASSHAENITIVSHLHRVSQWSSEVENGVTFLKCPKLGAALSHLCEVYVYGSFLWVRSGDSNR